MSSQRESSDNEANLSTSNNAEPVIVVLDSDRLNYEEERMKSFASWPVHYPVDPVRLAKAGFYYTGSEDEVECFSCQGHVKNWNYGDIVLKKHSDLYPNCDFVRNVSNNVPLLKSSVDSKQQSCNIKNSSDIMQININIDYQKMKSETERMKSFGGKWPLTNINIADLAHAGYFYMGIDEKVQCAFCKIIVTDLKKKNAFTGEYLKHFPWCDYLNNKSETFPGKEKYKQPWYHSGSQDVCGNMKPTDSKCKKTWIENKLISSNQQRLDLEDLGVHLLTNPVHPQYASIIARLGTFNSWPSNAPVSKQDLAAAGFFHLGSKDSTVCFQCNGGLNKWEEGDDPWIEHARWFSSCDFVRLNKGSDFIVASLLKSTSTYMDENPELAIQPDASESLLKKLDEVMKSNAVKNLLESGIFPPYILRAAILIQIKHTGSSFSNCDELCVAASYLRDKMEEQYTEKLVQAEELSICIKVSKNLTIADAANELNAMQQTTSHSSNTSDEKNLNKGESMASADVNYAQKPMELSDNEDHYLCKICMDRELGVVFLPCGHLPACTVCAPALKQCPLCRKQIQATVRCYFQ